MVYDAGFLYGSGTYSTGVGATTDYTGITFNHLVGTVSQSQGLTISGSGDSKTITMYVCSGTSGTGSGEICIRSKMAASAFTQDGLSVSANAAKADIFINGVSYTGTSANSAGVRVLGVSTSYSGSVSVDDTGNSGQEDSETFGAGYFITEKTIKTSTTTITTSTDWTNFPTATVQKNEQSLTSDSGSECGYQTGDWYSTAVGSYANAKAFFIAQGFTDMKCMMFSFAAGDTTKTSFVWDPILGIDQSAAAQSAASTNSASDDFATWKIVVIAVVGVALQIFYAN